MTADEPDAVLVDVAGHVHWQSGHVRYRPAPRCNTLLQGPLRIIAAAAAVARQHPLCTACFPLPGGNP